MTSLSIDGINGVQPSGTIAERPAGPRVAHKVDELEPMQQFEAFALRSFVESMLPSDASNFFGSGTAGDIWRSMMAEQLGEQIARAGGIGIADTVAKDRGLSSEAQSEILTQQNQSARMRFDNVLAQTNKP